MRGKRSQTDISSIIALVIFLPIILSIIALIGNMVTESTCGPYQQEISQLKNQISQLEGQLQEAVSIAGFWKDQYENLTTTNITKQDFIELKAELRTVTDKLNTTEREVYRIQQQIVNVYQTRTTIFAFSFLISINLALLSWTFIDFAICDLKFTKKVITKLGQWRQDVKIVVGGSKKL